MSAEPLRKDPESEEKVAPAPLASVPNAPASAEKAPAAPEKDNKGNEQHDEVHKNPVRQSVEEICELLGDSHEIRQEIMARGVQFNTLNVLVDYGTQNKTDEQGDLIKSTVSASRKEYGDAGITEEQLKKQLEDLVTIERDIGHVRRLSQNQGMNMQALNFLTQIIRLNPGDGGEKSVNNFLSYALACGIKLDNVKADAKEITAGTGSVLPQIPRPDEPTNEQQLKVILRDVGIGLLLSLCVLWLFL